VLVLFSVALLWFRPHNFTNHHIGTVHDVVATDMGQPPSAWC